VKITVIQNSPSAGIGLLAPVLERKYGFVIETVDAMTVDFTGIEPHGSDLFVILGSPRSVYERDVPWIDAEFRLTCRLLKVDAPLFGICFGGQMIASALGAPVGPMGERHYGWRVNDVAAHEVWKGPWFRWHGDRFEVPQGAELLAASNGIPQGFQKGHAIGVQFHPEVNEAIVRTWVCEGRDSLARDGCDGEQLLDESISRRTHIEPVVDGLIADIIRRCGVL
jgi:GMP synthase (glutamine-hydrolysing)